ncbi:GNAT family N-acetyltransferase [Rhodopirellula halodulae]|uniref:GNAT family N-acetyltransferase n=1 Tax=Rhodopirellula halodulae TaxID=2894198 RepID=UPI001E3930A2|nr:GNAT family N-acetyltransferase [Rhodopirellula sp. JC737]MCC9656122.1 GNAT family N-acetyltransferase [Rhodopirellula sp. JC737]
MPFTHLYRAIRRLHVIDVTCLLHADANTVTDAPTADSRLLDSEITIQQIAPAELANLKSDDRIHPVVGSGIAHTDASSDHIAGDQWLVGAFENERVVAFVWAATGYIPASDNYSRSVHLGSSLTMPPHCGFLFNAWTDPNHRGRGLMGALLRELVAKDLLQLRLTDWFATTDWTNHASQRVFANSGFETIGRLYRMGRGQMQASLVPDLERRMNQSLTSDDPRSRPLIASDAPGLRRAW